MDCKGRSVDVVVLQKCTEIKWHVPHGGAAPLDMHTGASCFCTRKQSYTQRFVTMATMLRCPAMRAVTSTGRQVMSSHTRPASCSRFLHMMFEAHRACCAFQMITAFRS